MSNAYLDSECSHKYSCFKLAYGDHCTTKHLRVRKGPERKSPISGITDISTVDNETIDGLDDDNWVVSGSEKEYIPMAEDVGCVLKVCSSDQPENTL